MSRPYYKCNAVSVTTEKTEDTSFMIYVYIVIIVAITGIVNKYLFQMPEIKHRTIILAGLAAVLFVVLILWMVGSIRSEGFRGGRNRNIGEQSRTVVQNTTTQQSTKKTNLPPTLLAVLPIIAVSLFLTIGHIIYKIM